MPERLRGFTTRRYINPFYLYLYLTGWCHFPNFAVRMLLSARVTSGVIFSSGECYVSVGCDRIHWMCRVNHPYVLPSLSQSIVCRALLTYVSVSLWRRISRCRWCSAYVLHYTTHAVCCPPSVSVCGRLDTTTNHRSAVPDQDKTPLVVVVVVVVVDPTIISNVP